MMVAGGRICDPKMISPIDAGSSARLDGEVVIGVVRVRWWRVAGALGLLVGLALGCCTFLDQGEAGFPQNEHSCCEHANNFEHDLIDLRQELARTRKQLDEKEHLIGMVGGCVNFSDLAPGPRLPAIDAEVLAVKSDIEPNLVLLSAGSNDGVEQGFRFSVYRASSFIGKVVVERVLDDRSGCRVLFTAEGHKIEPADLAATRLR